MQLINRSFWVTVLCGCLLWNSPLHAKESNELSLFFDASEMVESPSRYPKPLSQVTEQVTVFTTEDIERAHVHTIDQFLSEVPGLFMEFLSPDLGQSGHINALGSRNYHTLVLVDGVRQNIGANGTPFIYGLSPSIVKKIEIIKGPASSVWGSSLGGVINIITKDAGTSSRPSGMVTASFGEGPYSAVNGEVQGKAARLGYYFNAAHLDSDGLLKDRYTRNESFYSKFNLPLAHDISLGLTYSDSFPRDKALEWNGAGGKDYTSNHSRFGTFTLDAPFADDFHLHAALSRFMMDFADERDNFTDNSNYFDQTWSEDATEASIRISWTGTRRSAVLGAETRRGSMDYSYDLWPTSFHFDNPTAREEQIGVYTNASLTFGDFTISPGIRYDRNSNSGDVVSPSLGALYQLAKHTNLRCTIARGFATPYLWTLYSPFGGNTSLQQERIWNYQAGIETTYFRHLLVNATVFHHQSKDTLDISNYANNGKMRRIGGELDLETLPWHNLSFKAAFSTASEDNISYENEKTYAANLTVLYDEPSLGRAKLNGRYVWWNRFVTSATPGTYDDFIWDLVVDKEVMARDNYRTEVFLAAHNLFNGTQSWDVDYEIPPRWVEGGVTLRF